MVKRWGVAAFIGLFAIVIGVALQNAGVIQSQVLGPIVGAFAIFAWLQVSK